MLSTELFKGLLSVSAESHIPEQSFASVKVSFFARQGKPTRVLLFLPFGSVPRGTWNCWAMRWFYFYFSEDEDMLLFLFYDDVLGCVTQRGSAHAGWGERVFDHQEKERGRIMFPGRNFWKNRFQDPTGSSS